MSTQHEINRRRFLTASVSAAAFTIVPRRVLGGANFVAPSDRVQIGYAGTGTQGIRQLMQALPREDVQIVAVCDPNQQSDDYIDWFQNELRDKVRNFLEDPNWAEGAKGCRCGRKVGQEIVARHYGRNTRSGNFAGCSAYADFREMLDQEKDLDALYIVAPDHLHGSIAVTAMRQGKHVITHKPISNIFHETRVAVDTAAQTGTATHMFCSAGLESTPQIAEWIAAGAIGAVREVHNWSSRPFWPQGMTAYPQETVSVPPGLQWDVWLGPVPDRPYHPALTHAVFRGWYEYGAGALGDMGHYSFYQIFKILNLGSPVAVEASRSQYWAIIDQLWQKQENRVSYPRASMIHWEFAPRENRPAVSLYWYDGGLRPPRPAELDVNNEEMPDEGLLFVGDDGKILAGFNGSGPRLIPVAKMSAFQPPHASLPRPAGELDQWLRACRGGEPSDASFQNVYPFAETICLGNIALRFDQKLKWDAASRQFTNSAEANQRLRRSAYRSGWEKLFA